MLEEKLFVVQLLLSLPTGTVDLNEEVYTADVKLGESMSFTLDKTSTQEPLSLKEVRSRIRSH